MLPITMHTFKKINCFNLYPLYCMNDPGLHHGEIIYISTYYLQRKFTCVFVLATCHLEYLLYVLMEFNFNEVIMHVSHIN